MWLGQSKWTEVAGDEIWEVMDEADCAGLLGSWKISDLYYELGGKPLESLEQRNHRIWPTWLRVDLGLATI